MKRLSLLIASSFLIAAPAAASERAPVIEALNAKREAHGIPAGITENPSWSAACNAHVNYMNLNDYFGHDEDPSKPGYTPEGARAGKSSVLTSGGWGGLNDSPFELAPIHLAQLLAPRLSVTGFSDGGSCIFTWPGYQREAPEDTLTFYSYPGNGTKNWRYQEVTRESPFTPAEALGLFNPTGPHIYIFPWGGQYYQLVLKSATITGPQGAVALGSVWRGDGSKVSSYLPDGAILIPENPLAPNSSYTVRTEWQDAKPARDWPAEQVAADFERVVGLFSLTEAERSSAMDQFSRASYKPSEWERVVEACRRSRSGSSDKNTPPYNKPLPRDTACQTSETVAVDERTFSTGALEKDESEEEIDGDILISLKPRGRRAAVTIRPDSPWVGQKASIKTVWKVGKKKRTAAKEISLTQKTLFTVKSPFKKGKVRLTVYGRSEANDDYNGLYRFQATKSWKIKKSSK